MKYRLYTFLLISACLIACTSKIKDSDKFTINLDENVRDQILFSSFVDSIEYVHLELNDDCLLGKIRDVIISDTCVLILNEERTSISIFNREGRFVRKIEHIGQGPGEYRNIIQFSYNSHRNSVSIITYNDEIIEYDLFDNLIRTIKTGIYSADIYTFNDGSYLLSRTQAIDDPEVVFLTDSTGKVVKSLLNKNPLYNIDSSDHWELSKFSDGVHLISPRIDDIIYSYKENALEKVLELDIVPDPSSDFYQKRPGVLGLGENYCRTIYRESSKWLNLAFWSITKDLRVILFNKETNQCVVGSCFKNDIDNEGVGEYLSASDNNTFTGYFESKDFDSNPIIQILHLK